MQAQVPRKNYKRSIRTYVFVSMFLLIGAAVYGYFEYTKLAMAQDAIVQEDEQLIALTDRQTKFHDEYLNSNNAYQKEFQSINSQIEDVFPVTEDYTGLTMKLDKFVSELSRTNNPILMTNLDFSRSAEGDGDYMIMPFSVNITTTRSNFETFMRFIQNSGELQEGTRLMDIKSLSMNFGGFIESEDETTTISEPILSVNMTANSYFQKPAPGTTTVVPAT